MRDDSVEGGRGGVDEAENGIDCVQDDGLEVDDLFGRDELGASKG